MNQMGELELKRCPCCGSAAEFRCVPGGGDENSGGEFIECIECGLTTPLLFPCMEDVKPLLAEKWNRRAAGPLPADLRRDTDMTGAPEGKTDDGL